MSDYIKEKMNAKTQEFLKAIFGDDEVNTILSEKEKAKFKNSVSRETLRQIPTEAQEARKFADFLRLKKIVFLHIPNERKATARAVAELKRQGLQKGAPDYLVFLNNQIIAIELKRQSKSKSRVSKEQQEFINLLNSFDYMSAFVCYGANEAIKLIEKNLK